MDNSNNNYLNILNLPNEILIKIFNKLNMVDVLYSLVDVNERFDRLVIDPFYIRHLDMIIKSSFDNIISIDNEVLSRICSKILPRIHDQVNTLAVESSSIKSILTVNYPQLYSLSLVNFQAEILFQYLTDDSILRNLLSEQITDLNIDIQKYTTGEFSRDLSETFTLILSLSKRLISLNFCQLFRYRRLSIWFPTGPSEMCISSTLTKLKIEVRSFGDCLYLLDGRLDCLSTLIIKMSKICLTELHHYNTKKLPRLKYFSLTSFNHTIYYDQQIIPLLCRMINLEELILFLSVTRFDSNFIDGIQLYDQFLVYMPQLNKFTFSINTVVVNNNIRTNLSSHEDIQRSFIGRGYGQVGSCVHTTLMKDKGTCHIYSLSFQFEHFIYLNNSFQGGIFHKVRCLKMIDTHPFEHKFFKIISEDFPFLKILYLCNHQSQNDKENFSTLITFSHLTLLHLQKTHVDYAEQFLFRKNTHLPCLLDLCIGYESLAMITNNFTNDTSCLNFDKLKALVITEPFVRPENFHKYFFFL